AAMPEWKRYGVLAFTINLQGGSPGGQGGRGRGAGAGRPAGPATPAPGGGARGPGGPMVENTAIDQEGNLRPAYMARLQKILDRADELGMAAIVGYFYFGQDQRLKD